MTFTFQKNREGRRARSRARVLSKSLQMQHGWGAWEGPNARAFPRVFDPDNLRSSLGHCSWALSPRSIYIYFRIIFRCQSNPIFKMGLKFCHVPVAEASFWPKLRGGQRATLRHCDRSDLGWQFYQQSHEPRGVLQLCSPGKSVDISGFKPKKIGITVKPANIGETTCKHRR